MRLWQEEPDDKAKPASKRAYETVGYVIKGSAELHIEGQMVKLNEGDSWLVPKDAEHNYKILQSFTAVEATHPPAEIHDRDETVCAEDKTCADDKGSAADKTCVEDKTSAEDKRSKRKK
jgi:mannose-6-phosphate isomerase-like protein (cupin superfamily)